MDCIKICKYLSIFFEVQNVIMSYGNIIKAWLLPVMFRFAYKTVSSNTVTKPQLSSKDTDQSNSGIHGQSGG